MAELQEKIVRIADVFSSPVNEELVMFDTEAGKYYSLNGMAAVIWRCLENPMTVDALCAELMEAFDVPPEHCRAEVLAFVSTLEAKGLVGKRVAEA